MNNLFFFIKRLQQNGASTEIYLNNIKCWVCQCNVLKKVKSLNLFTAANSNHFAITDSNYGITGELLQCKNCGFIQCSEQNDVMKYYEELKDEEYDEECTGRTLHFKKILSIVSKYVSKGTLLDIGAGSGILVQEALKMGYKAEGIEPSKYLEAKASARGLHIHLGVFPHPECPSSLRYDIITMIDVIEHVQEPLNILINIRKVISRDGIVVILTPDVSSVMAYLFGWKWWHFRYAHIGYFNKKTLNLAMDKAGFQLIRVYRPGWYFSIAYLFNRAMKYFPKALRITLPSVLENVVVPLNLRDSIMGIYRTK